ncbi:hypothetical protein MRB53_021285 [Persea americana]|uniref:Uncharacterized protein n=1 Tax=Persea americana TaxID=3435 RepID=A0ACC2L3N9_PERAE|nr:hypothetical protein MRB53_021285 [Persea americana]
MQQLNPSAYADRVADLARWKAAMAAQTQVSGLDPYMEALKNVAARLIGTTPYAHNLMGITDPTPNTKTYNDLQNKKDQTTTNQKEIKE